MNGGEISGNTSSSSGGGVYNDGSNTSFRMSGGVIYGTNAATGLKNIASGGGASLYRNSGTAQYGVLSGDTFTRSGDLTTTNDTIRVENGSLRNN